MRLSPRWNKHTSTDKAVKSPGDMGGVKVRSQDSPVHTGLWKALGSAPVVMEISEVQGKLEKGEITVAAQTPLYTFAAGWQAFVKHYTLTRHVYQTALIMYSKKTLAFHAIIRFFLPLTRPFLRCLQISLCCLPRCFLAEFFRLNLL